MANAITDFQVGTKLTYTGGASHENEAHCLIKGAEYEIESVVTGIHAMIMGCPGGMPIFKDESEEGFWAITPEDLGCFEIIG